MSDADGWRDGYPPIETTNDYGVGATAGSIMIMVRPTMPMRFEKALRLAAWIVALADHSPDHERFRAILDAVEQT